MIFEFLDFNDIQKLILDNCQSPMEIVKGDTYVCLNLLLGNLLTVW